MATQEEKGRKFRALHQRSEAFVIPNPWDAGSARLLEHLGFEALATTSAGFAFSVGRADNMVSREEMMAHVKMIAAASDLPASADLENGFGDKPQDAAETIRLAAANGVVGGSIEDSSQKDDAPIYEFGLAVDRVRAAAEAARALPFQFTFTARCENYLCGRPDLRETILRLQAYQEAGADVLYAPGITDLREIAELVRSVDRPVNILAGMPGAPFTVAELSKLGVKRVSVGSALSRAAYGGFMRAAREMRESRTFAFADQAASFGDLTAIFAKKRA